jgi:tetratricopeptide (TPR) repeat protein
MFPLTFHYVRAVCEPQRPADTAGFVAAAMMTPSYAHFGERLAASCRAHAVPLALFAVPGVHRSISAAGIEDLRYTKANFVHFLLERYGRPVLYLDVDCEIVQQPVLFQELLTGQVDFAIFNWFAAEHTEAYIPAAVDGGDAQRPSEHRFYRFSHSIDVMSDTQLFCSGAVQWYNNTESARHLLKTWQGVIERAPGRADDKCLDLAFNNYPADAPRLKTSWLDKRYARIAWWIYERPVIDHPEFPGTGAGFAQLEAVDGQPRFHMDGLRQTDVTPVFPKDCLIDSETRTLLRWVDGTWQSAGSVSVPLWLRRASGALGNEARPNAEAKFREAMALHRQSRLQEAEAAYEQVLSREPQHVQALTFLGVLAFQNQRFDRALEMTNRALAVDPRSAGTHLMRGHALTQLGRLQEAVDSYDEVIGLKSDLADAYLHRGNVLGEMGRHHEAVASYDGALKLDPGNAQAHNNRGNSLRGLNLHEAAIASYEAAVNIVPHFAEPYFNRGLALYELQRYEAALSSYDSAIAIRPDYAEAHLSRGNVLHQLRRRADALASYDKAVAIKGDYAQAYSNRANVLSELERFDAALESYDLALSLDPLHAEFHCNRGNVLVDLGRHEEAGKSFDRAVDLDPGYAQAYFSRSILGLLRGDFERGWRDFEWRWKNEYIVTSQERRQFPKPRWQGEGSVAGKTILLHCEQGLGDSIQFCRFAEVVAALGARVVFEAPKMLAGLLKSLRGVSQLVVHGEPLPDFDCWCPLLSLPMALNTTLETIPARIPYLQSGAGRSRYWRDKLGPRTKLRVGLVWSGGFRADQPELWAVNNRRNIPLQLLAGLEHPGIEFYSLQKGQPAEEELAQLQARDWGGPALIDFTSELYDFEETAALVEQLDLVISVDTSTAHLAGALGKPVWLLNRFDTCWRWLLHRTDSPWYPSLRIYRQERWADWDSVVRDVRCDLHHLARDVRNSR